MSVRLDVLFGAHEVTPQDVSGRVVAVIDVLRASTTIAAALHAGARAVIPFASTEEAATRARGMDRDAVRLGGERKMLPIPGFDFGNSPAEYTPKSVGGKTLLFTTTNGTAALVATQGARDVVVASFANFTAAGALLRAALRGGNPVTLLCAGRDGHFSLEDAVCAGRLAKHLVQRNAKVQLGDATLACQLLAKKFEHSLARVFEQSEHGRALVEAGFARDLEICATLDAFPVVPVYHDRQVTKLGPDLVR
ncbi:MAG: 2-phosphosulfolactate phosphatase [Gemmatimonadota bacterium]